MTNAAYADDFDRVRPQKMRPLTAFRAFQKLIRNKEDTAQVFEIMRALSGRSVSRGYNRMLRSVEGGRQAFLAEELATKLDDPVWLARFGPGTVGAAYRDFREARGFTADGLADAEREVIPFVDAEHPIVWYSRRLRDVHDIWHVLTGYGTDALGEACVVSFSYGQTRNLGFAFIGWGAAREIQREAATFPPARPPSRPGATAAPPAGCPASTTTPCLPSRWTPPAPASASARRPSMRPCPRRGSWASSSAPPDYSPAGSGPASGVATGRGVRSISTSDPGPLSLPST
jgi:ubiquinone biosynthesis protein COQ4